MTAMNSLEKRQTIATALQAFATRPLQEAALTLLTTLGYSSDKRIDLTLATAEGFLTTFGQDRPFNRDKAEIQEWRRVEFLFQFTNDEVLSLSSGQLSLMTDRVINGALIESFVFLAIELAVEVYSRSRLAAITREVNRLFPMPVIILFRYGPSLSLTVIRGRLHQRDATRDVLEKVTLVKDIAFAEPLRAHLDILHDFSLSALQADFGLHDFVGLHTAWEKRLDTYQLNERFYRDIANWYFWALQHPGLIPPRAVVTEEQRALFICFS